MRKILLAPINAVVWMSHNPAETLLLSVFGLSMTPFLMDVASPGLVGGLIASFACIAEKYAFGREKPSRLYNILVIVILIIGSVGIFMIGEKDYQRIWSQVDNSLATYVGAFFGILAAHFLISFIENEREEKRKQKEIDRMVAERQKEQRVISQKEKEGFVAIKRDGKLIGYIEKGKYDLFVDGNIQKEEATI